MSNENEDSRWSEGRRVFIGDGSKVRAGEELLYLCRMCKKSRLTCGNYLIREVEVPLSPEENPEDHGQLVQERQPDGSILEFRTSTKRVDGVKTGLLTQEVDIPIPTVCDYFELKDSG